MVYDVVSRLDKIIIYFVELGIKVNGGYLWKTLSSEWYQRRNLWQLTQFIGARTHTTKDTLICLKKHVPYLIWPTN